jgi:hypothetical protein
MNKKIIVALSALAASTSASAGPVLVAPAALSAPVFNAAGIAAAAASRSALSAPSLSGAALTAPSLTSALAPASFAAPAALAAAPAAAAAPGFSASAAAAAPAASAIDGLRAASPAPAASAEADPSAAARPFDGSPAFSAPDNEYQWLDQHTGQFETQTSKIKKTYDLALTHPLAAGIKNALSRNTLYRVDNSQGPWYLHTSVRTQGDDNEKTSEPDALVVFNHNALQQLSPEFLAAKLASMWARHLYRDTIPASAEKTYVEGSVLVRVFMGLTGSTAQNWNGDKDYFIGGTFELYRHFYNWIQGFRFANVRQGPYFLDKIMHAQGDPSIDADARGRMTLFQRAQAGQITGPAAQAAQQRFDNFVSNERPH